ncbi:MAG: bifunctional riboflavin kinase/FAD synthetase [Leptonema sp. (in: bacteria)]
MLIVHNIHKFIPDWEHSSLTLGVFDGIHLGHQELLKKIQKQKDSLKRVLVTYHPHPDLVLKKRNEEYGTELFTYEEKLSLLQEYDIDVVVFIEFNNELANTTAETYLKEFLINKLKAKYIVIGYDQCFGKNREGNYNFLLQKSKIYGYEVEQIEPVRLDGQVVSSSKIRALIKIGDIETANRMLGKSFFLTGTVVKGFQRGKWIGFPTANLDIPLTKVIPKIGVYRGFCEYAGSLFRAMINIGYNPTFQNQLLSVEAHILDFEKNIYGEQIRIYFFDRIRDEKQFSNVEELKEQLKKDKTKTQELEFDQCKKR